MEIRGAQLVFNEDLRYPSSIWGSCMACLSIPDKVAVI